MSRTVLLILIAVTIVAILGGQMEMITFFIFLFLMLLLMIDVVVYPFVFILTVVRRDFNKTKRLCVIGGIWLCVHMIWTYVVPGGETSSRQFSGLPALMHFVYFGVLWWVLISIAKLKPAQPNLPLQDDAQKDDAPLT